MTTATKTATATWLVECKNHDCGAQDVHFIRKSQKDAERSARLFRQCGYRQVTTRRYTN